MHKEEFIKKLRTELSKLPQEERDAAVEYYTEYFDEAGAENEEKVLKELGSPRQVAAQIKSEYAVRLFDEEEKPTVKKGLSTIWYVIIGICSAPIALPLALFLGGLAILGLAVLLMVSIAVFLGLLFGFVASAVSVYIGLTMFTSSVAVALTLIGAGLLGMGLTLALGVLLTIAVRKLGRAMIHADKKHRERRRVRHILREGEAHKNMQAVNTENVTQAKAGKERGEENA